MLKGTKVTLSILALVIAAIAVFPAPVSATFSTITVTTTLTADHVEGIIIGADGITLDCAGCSVIGSGGGIGILLDGRTGVTVKNCIVTNFLVGFRLFSSDDNTLTENTAEGNLAGGFQVASGSVGNTITGNSIKMNDRGIRICLSLLPPQNKMAPNQFMGPHVAIFITLTAK